MLLELRSHPRNWVPWPMVRDSNPHLEQIRGPRWTVEAPAELFGVGAPRMRNNLAKFGLPLRQPAENFSPPCVAWVRACCAAEEWPRKLRAPAGGWTLRSAERVRPHLSVSMSKGTIAQVRKIRGWWWWWVGGGRKHASAAVFLTSLSLSSHGTEQRRTNSRNCCKTRAKTPKRSVKKEKKGEGGGAKTGG